MEPSATAALDLTAIIIASVSIIPATIAALYARRTKRNTETGNGETLADQVRENKSHLSMIDSRLNMIEFEIKGVALQQDLLNKMFAAKERVDEGTDQGQAGQP